MMYCPECISPMFLVDNGQTGPVWACACGHVLDYEPSDSGEDDGRLEEFKIATNERDK